MIIEDGSRNGDLFGSEAACVDNVEVRLSRERSSFWLGLVLVESM